MGSTTWVSFLYRRRRITSVQSVQELWYGVQARFQEDTAISMICLIV